MVRKDDSLSFFQTLRKTVRVGKEAISQIWSLISPQIWKVYAPAIIVGSFSVIASMWQKQILVDYAFGNNQEFKDEHEEISKKSSELLRNEAHKAVKANCLKERELSQFYSYP